jgi:oligo-1,6-glucosidase
MYSSPGKDGGYDISDYKAVDPRYETFADMQELIDKCHENGMKLILDLVVNHTSDQHYWFRESRWDKASEKRDWYFWRPARYDKHGERMPPTNWRSYRGGSAWTWDEQTQEYYLHIYDAPQPDLNWENPDCRTAIYDSAMRFWLTAGSTGSASTR